MTPQSKAVDFIERSLLDAAPIRDDERQARAARALSYLESATAQEEDLTAAWLEQYHPDAREFWESQPKSIFNIFAAIIHKLCTVYSRPVVRTWPKGADRWAKAWARVQGFDSLMQDIDEQTLACGTLAVRPLVLDEGEPATHAIYTADQIEYSPNAQDRAIAEQLVFAWENGTGDSNTETKHFWTRELFMWTLDDDIQPGPTDAKGKPIWPKGEVPGSWKHPYRKNADVGMIPAIIFRNRNPRKRFFDEPATDMVLAALALNRGITDLTYALPAHCSPTLVLAGADETKPTKLGLRSKISLDAGGSASFLTPNAPISEIIAALQFLLGLFLSSRGIPEDTFIAKQQGQSGVAIVAKDASLNEWRDKRINQFRPLEQDLMRLTVMVQEIHDGRPCTFDEVPVPTITYAKPKIALSADERQEWMDKIRLGAATVLDMMMAEDPTLDEKTALKRWQDNQEFNRAANAGPVFDREQKQDGEGGKKESAPARVADDVQKLALNGAQMSSLQAMLLSVGTGEVSKAAAIEFIQIALPSTAVEDARKLINAVKVVARKDVE